MVVERRTDLSNRFVRCVNDVQTNCIFFDIPFRVCIKDLIESQQISNGNNETIHLLGYHQLLSLP